MRTALESCGNTASNSLNWGSARRPLINATIAGSYVSALAASTSPIIGGLARRAVINASDVNMQRGPFVLDGFLDLVLGGDGSPPLGPPSERQAVPHSRSHSRDRGQAGGESDGVWEAGRFGTSAARGVDPWIRVSSTHRGCAP